MMGLCPWLAGWIASHRIYIYSQTAFRCHVECLYIYEYQQQLLCVWLVNLIPH